MEIIRNYGVLILLYLDIMMLVISIWIVVLLAKALMVQNNSLLTVVHSEMQNNEVARFLCS